MVQQAYSLEARTSGPSCSVRWAGTEGLDRTVLLTCFGCQEVQKSEVVLVVSVIVLSTRCLFYTCSDNRKGLGHSVAPQDIPRCSWEPRPCAWPCVPDRAPCPLCRTPSMSFNVCRNVVFLSLFSFSDNLKSQLCPGGNYI